MLAISFVWFELKFLPNPMLIFLLGAAIFLDFFSGIIKSIKTGQCTTYYRLLQTGLKMATYAVIIAAMEILVNVMSMTQTSPVFDYSLIPNTASGFLIFIELYSAFLNLAKAFPRSPLTKYFLKPLIKLLKGKLENEHPIKSELDKTI